MFDRVAQQMLTSMQASLRAENMTIVHCNQVYSSSFSILSCMLHLKQQYVWHNCPARTDQHASRWASCTEHDYSTLHANILACLETVLHAAPKVVTLLTQWSSTWFAIDCRCRVLDWAASAMICICIQSTLMPVRCNKSWAPTCWLCCWECESLATMKTITNHLW